ncbi:hypothetical protein CRYUN_Cryun39dG0060600 [Craigia yunnanensis]
MAPSFDNGSSLFNFVVRDGNGVKGMVDSGISKVPQAYIQPPAERIDKNNASKHGQSPIDLSRLDGPDHDEVAKEIVRATETLGFLQVVNHGVPVDLLESLKDTAHNFFSLPTERKAIYRTEVSPTPLVKEVALEYLKTSHDMVKKLLEVLMENLEVKQDVSKIDSLIGKKTVNMNFYPICPNPELIVGVGRHFNMGTLTILLQDVIGGLYVNIPEDADIGKKGEWVEIPPILGALVINVGDMLQVQIITMGHFV